MNIKTYADMITLLESPDSKDVYIPITYKKGTMEWFKIDKDHYLTYLKQITNPEEFPFPCYIERESDGEIFFHPKILHPSDENN